MIFSSSSIAPPVPASASGASSRPLVGVVSEPGPAALAAVLSALSEVQSPAIAAKDGLLDLRGRASAVGVGALPPEGIVRRPGPVAAVAVGATEAIVVVSAAVTEVHDDVFRLATAHAFR